MNEWENNLSANKFLRVMTIVNEWTRMSFFLGSFLSREAFKQALRVVLLTPKLLHSFLAWGIYKGIGEI